MIMREKRFFVTTVLLAAAFAFHGAAVHAQGPVSVQVRLILASNDPGFSGTSPELSDLAENLGSLFKYNGYKLLTTSAASVSPGKPADVNLAYGTRLEMASAGGKKNGNSLSVRWIQPPRGEIVSTQVRLRGRSPVLIGGPTVKDGVLIVALSLK